MKLRHFHTLFRCLLCNKNSQEFPDSREILRNFVGENSWEFLQNFSKLSLKTVIPQKSIILGTTSGEFFENIRGISYRILEKFLKILQKKSPRLENLGKLLTFVTWELIKSVHLTYRSCAYDLQKVYIQPTIDGTIWPTKSVHPTYKKCTYDLRKVYIRPTKSVYLTYKKCTSNLKKSVHPTYKKCTFDLWKL